MSAHPETTPARGPSDAPTKPETLPAWLKRWVSRTKVQAIKSTPIVASANASGTARPMVVAVPCGLMLAAIEGAMRASEIPTASHRCSSRRRRGPSALPALLTSVAMLTPLLCRIRWAERPLDPTRRMPPEFGHWCPRVPGAALPRAGATPPAHPPEPHSKPASRPPGLSVIPPFPRGMRSISPSVPTFHGSRPRQRAPRTGGRSEEHTSELQSRQYLVCRLLLEKKKKTTKQTTTHNQTKKKTKT